MSDTESEPMIEKPKRERTPAQLAAFEKARAKMLAQREARLAEKSKPKLDAIPEPETPKRKSKVKKSQKIIIEDESEDDDEPHQTIIVKRKSKSKPKPKVVYESESEGDYAQDGASATPTYIPPQSYLRFV